MNLTIRTIWLKIALFFCRIILKLFVVSKAHVLQPLQCSDIYIIVLYRQERMGKEKGA